MENRNTYNRKRLFRRLLCCLLAAAALFAAAQISVWADTAEDLALTYTLPATDPGFVYGAAVEGAEIGTVTPSDKTDLTLSSYSYSVMISGGTSYSSTAEDERISVAFSDPTKDTDGKVTVTMTKGSLVSAGTYYIVVTAALSSGNSAVVSIPVTVEKAEQLRLDAPVTTLSSDGGTVTLSLNAAAQAYVDAKAGCTGIVQYAVAYTDTSTGKDVKYRGWDTENTIALSDQYTIYKCYCRLKGDDNYKDGECSVATVLNTGNDVPTEDLPDYDYLEWVKLTDESISMFEEGETYPMLMVDQSNGETEYIALEKSSVSSYAGQPQQKALTYTLEGKAVLNTKPTYYLSYPQSETYAGNSILLDRYDFWGSNNPFRALKRDYDLSKKYDPLIVWSGNYTLDRQTDSGLSYYSISSLGSSMSEFDSALAFSNKEYTFRSDASFGENYFLAATLNEIGSNKEDLSVTISAKTSEDKWVTLVPKCSHTLSTDGDTANETVTFGTYQPNTKNTETIDSALQNFVSSTDETVGNHVAAVHIRLQSDTSTGIYYTGSNSTTTKVVNTETINMTPYLTDGTYNGTEIAEAGILGSSTGVAEVPALCRVPEFNDTKSWGYGGFIWNAAMARRAAMDDYDKCAEAANAGKEVNEYAGKCGRYFSIDGLESNIFDGCIPMRFFSSEAEIDYSNKLAPGYTDDKKGTFTDSYYILNSKAGSVKALEDYITSDLFFCSEANSVVPATAVNPVIFLAVNRKIKEITNKNGDPQYTITKGSTLRVVEDMIVPSGRTLLIEPGAVLVVSGTLYLEGNINNYGTILVCNGGYIVNSGNNGNISNYGKSYTCRDGSTAFGEGMLVVQKGGGVNVCGNNAYLYFNGTAGMVNNGIVIAAGQINTSLESNTGSGAVMTTKSSGVTVSGMTIETSDLKKLYAINWSDSKYDSTSDTPYSGSETTDLRESGAKVRAYDDGRKEDPSSEGSTTRERTEWGKGRDTISDGEHGYPAETGVGTDYFNFY